MPRGDNPNSRANLKRSSPSEARKNGRKGGIASGESRAAFKSLRTEMRERCEPERMGRIVETVLDLAEGGNLKAFELISRYLDDTAAEEEGSLAAFIISAYRRDSQS